MAPYARDPNSDVHEATLEAVEYLIDPTEGGDFYYVKIAQGAAGLTDLTAGIELGENDVVRLHELVGTMDAEGTIKVSYDDDGAGANAVDLLGPMAWGEACGVVYPWRRDPDGCFKGAAGKHLTITTTAGKLGGGAIISVGA